MEGSTTSLPETGELVAALNRELRRNSTWTVMLHEAVAQRAGLTGSEHKALDLLCDIGPITAGQLAELTGLTTGAITGIVDRLEKAGFAQREKDPGDRRRVIIRALPEKSGPVIGPLFSSLAEAMAELCSRYRKEELEVLLDFAARSNQVLQQETTKLRSE